MVSRGFSKAFKPASLQPKSWPDEKVWYLTNHTESFENAMTMLQETNEQVENTSYSSLVRTYKFTLRDTEADRKRKRAVAVHAMEFS